MRGALCLLLLALPLSAQTTLTLEEAERIAVENHPRSAAARLLARAAGESPKQVRATLSPFVSVNVSGSVAENQTRIGAGNLNASSLFSRSAAGLAIQQTVWDFGRVRALSASLEARASAMGETANAVRGEVILGVRESFFRLLLAQIQVRVLEENLEARRLTNRQIKALVGSQLRSTLDESVAELNVAEAELLLQRAASDVRAAEVNFSAALGYSEPKQYRLVDPADPESTLDADGEALVREALDARPDLASLRQQRRSADRFADSENRQSLPTLSLLGVAGVYGFKDEILRPRYAGMGLNLNIPILNGGQFASRRAEAALRAQAAAEDVRALEVRIAREVRAAWVEAVNARDRVRLSAKVLEQARKTRRLAQTRYDLGLGTVVELSAAQLSQTTAEVGAAAARFDYLLRRAALDFQAGRLR